MRRQHLVALDDPVVVCGIQGAGDPALVPFSILADLPLVPDEFGCGGEGEEWEQDGRELHGGGVFKLSWVWESGFGEKDEREMEAFRAGFYIPGRPLA
jgi:hypothetical protein